MKTKEELQAFVDEVREVCRKHNVVIVGTCNSEGIQGEITIIENGTGKLIRAGRHADNELMIDFREIDFTTDKIETYYVDGIGDYEVFSKEDLADPMKMDTYLEKMSIGKLGLSKRAAKFGCSLEPAEVDQGSSGGFILRLEENGTRVIPTRPVNVKELLQHSEEDLLNLFEMPQEHVTEVKIALAQFRLALRSSEV